ncbi:hypothetical protein M8C13_30875 [Crossiella sp. SN42]|uniref:hypothetical protein n=1 Tax=Crossiella sp. SN42 TaxID=2944808 RepID=UPI00207C13F4|nr:hypothetical protein [Crossiella sp. SN42]MCO1580168.1 hypothetical protein [Crossiella sp. SN42]
MLLPGPDTRVVELRVPGVLGATPESVTGSASAVDVAGDGLGRVVRPADRMERPVSGPSLSLGGRPIARVIEGYVWGAMTSGGVAKATWALLFPFTLANVAHWMLPPVPPGSRPAKVLGVLLRALLRVAALGLTMLFIGQLAVVSVDLVAAQCLSPALECAGGLTPAWLRDSATLRMISGLLPVLVAIAVLFRVSGVDWELAVPHTADPPGHAMSNLPGAGVTADPDTPALRGLHTAAAPATVAWLLLGGPAGPLRADLAALWGTTVLILGLCALGVLLLDDPGGSHPDRAGRWLRAALAPAPRRMLVLASLVLLGAAAAYTPELSGPLPASDGTVQGIAVGLGLCCVLFGLLLIPAALLARPTWRKLPRNLRPWAGGWMAAPVLGLAGLLGGGFGAGIAITFEQLLTPVQLDLPSGYRWVTLVWGTAAGVAVTVAVLCAPVVLLLRRLRVRRGSYVPPEVRLLHKDRPKDELRAARAWRRAEWQRRHAHHLLICFAGLLGLGAAASVTMQALGTPLPTGLAPLSGVGVVALGVLGGGLLYLVWLAARHPERAKQVGVLADLAAFWPREAHPTVPPCYAMKVVPELVARAQEHLKEPGNRVVLVGHSQGSLLAAVAVSRLLDSASEYDRERIGLVTAGSQLQWAYPRAFPAVVPFSSLAALNGQLGGRWRSLCRGTDPLGGAVTTWARQVYDGMMLGVGFRADGTTGPLPAATVGPNGALVLGGDHWLPDPMRGPFPFRRWAPGVLGHVQYQPDPEWDRAVSIAAGLEKP